MTGRPASLQLKVTLAGIRPPIWRRLVLAGDTTLAELHRILQVAVGWEEVHKHCFRIDGITYAPMDDDVLGIGQTDEASWTVAEAFATTTRGEYEYDFGDHWVHQLVVERAELRVVPVGLAMCTGGRRACPPEDCGGVAGYGEVLDALADVGTARQREMLAWLEDEYDPEAFDQATVNVRLGRLARRRRSTH